MSESDYFYLSLLFYPLLVIASFSESKKVKNIKFAIMGTLFLNLSYSTIIAYIWFSTIAIDGFSQEIGALIYLGCFLIIEVVLLYVFLMFRRKNPTKSKRQSAATTSKPKNEMLK